METQKPHIPFTEKLKSIPGVFGLHLTESPKYKVLRQNKSFELREYEPMVVARTTVQGKYEWVQKEAFLKLADYIFGKNIEHKTMAMTSPVFEETRVQGGTPALTMSFVLPSHFSGKTLPAPDDSSVQLQEIPAQTWAVIRYSGKNTPQEIRKKTRYLQNWMLSIGHQPDLQTLRVAQYDGPKTIPYFRHNEVQICLWTEKIH